MRKLVLASGLLMVAGAAAAGPRMAGFDAVAAAGERLDLTGAGWGRSGGFRLGAATGSFRRDLDGATVDGIDGPGTLVEHRGRLRFALSGPGIRGRLEGRCGSEEAQAVLGGRALTLSRTVAPYGLRCSFTIDGEPAGTLVLDAAFSGRVSVESVRIGEVVAGGSVLTLRSVHRFDRGRWPASAPLGYVMERDGRALAAVDVNGARKRMALPRDPATREIALAAGVALALAWDPGDQD